MGNKVVRTFVIHREGGEKIQASLGERLGGSKMWKWEEGVAKVFTVKGEFRKGAPFKRTGITTAPDLLDVVDVETGRDEVILCQKVLVSTLLENFPDGGYVGRTFSATQGPVPEGKRYKSFEIHEVTLSDAAQEPAKKASRK